MQSFQIEFCQKDVTYLKTLSFSLFEAVQSCYKDSGPRWVSHVGWWWSRHSDIARYKWSAPCMDTLIWARPHHSPRGPIFGVLLLVGQYRLFTTLLYKWPSSSSIWYGKPLYVLMPGKGLNYKAADMHTYIKGGLHHVTLRIDSPS